MGGRNVGASRSLGFTLVAALLLLSLPVVALAAPSGSPAGATRTLPATASGAMRSLAADDNIPGVPLPASPFSHALAKNVSEDAAPLDVYSVNLNEGDVFTFEVNSPLTSVLDVMIFAPGATDAWWDYPETWSTPVSWTQNRLQYYAPATGTYYVAVVNWWSEVAGSYTANWQKTTLSGDDDFAGAVAPVASPVAGTLNWRSDVSDVYAFDLLADQELTLQLSGPGANTMGTGGFDMFVYQADATSAWESMPAKISNVEGTSSESITYHCPPDGAGTVYVEVNTNVTDGSYSLTWSVTSPKVSRVSGASRYHTSYAIGAANMLSSDVAVIATARSFADALSASGLAGALDAPLLLAPNLSTGDGVDEFFRELIRLDVNECYVVGGTSAVSTDLTGWLKDEGYTVKRISGADRYATAAAVARKIAEINGAPGTAFLVRGDGFADALAAAPFAYSQGIPILLTKPTGLNSHSRAVLDDFDITDVIIAGGLSAVGANAESSAEALNGGFAATRIAGADRYSTAADLAAYAVDTRSWATWGFVGVATGANFPDALSGGAACGSRGGVMLLTKPNVLSAPASDAITANAGSIGHTMIFGGTGAVQNSVKTAIGNLLP